MTDHISDIKGWFELAVPTPTDKNRAVQIGVHFEEVLEMLQTLPTNHPCLRDDLADIANDYKRRQEVSHEEPDRIELLDALCDQIVTAVGVAHMMGFNLPGALAEVNRANWSKFVDGAPLFDSNGKITKGPLYLPPRLAPFVGGQHA